MNCRSNILIIILVCIFKYFASPLGDKNYQDFKYEEPVEIIM